PNFMQKEKTVSAAERGTAMHTVMQHLPMKTQMNEREVAAFIEKLVEREILTRLEEDIIDSQALAQFVMTDTAAAMRNAEEAYREVQLSLTLPASDVYAKWDRDTEEQVLIQGVIDRLRPLEDGGMMIDYKTDAMDWEVTERVRENLIKRYETQMALYRR